ncbi:MAG: FGGY-family carbohydrate kinase [Chitinophagales bacterium]
MNSFPVIGIFDIGKTNKKFLLFDEQYKIIQEESIQIPELTDEDGFPCENLNALRNWIKQMATAKMTSNQINLVAMNFSAYGASFVLVDEQGNPMTSLYNYLKPFPESLKNQFYQKYGGEELFSQLTASPVLGSLNSGLQLYRLKMERPELFDKVRYALHLPQWISSLMNHQFFSDMTSIGCHTGLWNFQKKRYHDWVELEGIVRKLAPVFPSVYTADMNWEGRTLITGIGLHDSSAALVPYLLLEEDPFILISSGTWNISLNPFNQTALTVEELASDCLCYLEFRGRPVKASRLFAGQEHEQQTRRLSEYFQQTPDYFKNIKFDQQVFSSLPKENQNNQAAARSGPLQVIKFNSRDLSQFPDYQAAYHQLILDIVTMQKDSTSLVLGENPVKRIVVDGGFSKNDLFMRMLAIAFPRHEIYAATIAQASALGAALAIHRSWNQNPIPKDLVDLVLFSSK